MLIIQFDEAEELGLGDFLTLKYTVGVAFVILGLLWLTAQSLNVQYCSFRQIEQKLQLWVQDGIVKAMVFSLGKTDDQL